MMTVEIKLEARSWELETACGTEPSEARDFEKKRFEYLVPKDFFQRLCLCQNGESLESRTGGTIARRSGISSLQISSHIGLTYSAVSRRASVVRKRLKAEGSFQRKFQRFKSQIKA